MKTTLRRWTTAWRQIGLRPRGHCRRSRLARQTIHVQTNGHDRARRDRRRGIALRTTSGSVIERSSGGRSRRRRRVGARNTTRELEATGTATRSPSRCASRCWSPPTRTPAAFGMCLSSKDRLDLACRAHLRSRAASVSTSSRCTSTIRTPFLFHRSATTRDAGMDSRVHSSRCP